MKLLLFTLLLFTIATLAFGFQFEVASIKPSRPDAGMQDMRIFFPPGRFDAANITLNEMLASFSGFAGKVRGDPAWAGSDRCDIAAKAAGEIAPGERGPMVMALLKDRFKLATHRETEEVSGLALVQGKKPPALQASKEGDETVIRVGDQGQVIFRSVNMARLVNYLSQIWRTPVVDRTGIAGKFDFILN